MIKKVSKDFPESVAHSSKCKDISSDEESAHNSNCSSSSVPSSDSDDEAAHGMFNIDDMSMDNDKKPAAKVRAPKAKRTKTHFKGVPATKMSAEEKAYQAKLTASVDPEVEDQFTSDSE